MQGTWCRRGVQRPALHFLCGARQIPLEMSGRLDLSLAVMAIQWPPPPNLAALGAMPKKESEARLQDAGPETLLLN